MDPTHGDHLPVTASLAQGNEELEQGETENKNAPYPFINLEKILR